MLLLLALALPQVSPEPSPEPPREAVDAAVRAGVAYLRAHQLPTGGWPFEGLGDREGCGNTALMLYALLASDVPRDDEAVVDALTNLSGTDCFRTYDAACLLLALARHDPLEHATWIDEVAARLLEWQTRDGDWGYPGGADLSNTQYAALGLRAAALAGSPVPAEAWRRTAAAVADYQRRDGSFGYQRGASATDSMSAAGAGTLALCAAMLGPEGDDDGARRRRARIEDALEHLGEHAERALRTDGGAWPYYRLYGVERVGAFARTERLGELGWYATGAAAILASQRADGSWGHPRDGGHDDWVLPRTAFALLFLQRASAAPLSPVGERSPAARRAGFHETGARRADVRLAARVDADVTLWIAGWGPTVRARERPGETGRGPRVVRVEYVVPAAEGDTVLATVAGDPRRPAGPRRFEARVPWPSGRAEELAVVARVTLLEADGAGSAGVASPPLALRYHRSAAGRAADERAERDANLLARARTRVAASSVFPGGVGLAERPYGPELAVDGRLRTPWLADPRDDRPALRIELESPVIADVLRIAPARAVPHRPRFFGRPIAIAVRVNDRPERVLTLRPDARDKAVLELERPVSIHRLELTILEQARGRGHPATGLAEVELALR